MHNGAAFLAIAVAVPCASTESVTLSKRVAAVSIESGYEIRVVELERDASGSLGLSIAGGLNSPLGDTPLVIAHMHPGGPADRSGALRVSDWFIVGVLHPGENNIFGHIRRCTDLSQCTLMATL